MKRKNSSNNRILSARTTEEFPRCRRNGVAGATTNRGDPLADIIGVNNRDLGGVTVGAGTCEDCVWGETEGHNCRPCRRGRNEVAGSEDRRRSKSNDNVAGIGYGTDGTLGIGEEMTTSRRNGCNGCSW